MVNVNCIFMYAPSSTGVNVNRTSTVLGEQGLTIKAKDSLV